MDRNVAPGYLRLLLSDRDRSRPCPAPSEMAEYQNSILEIGASCVKLARWSCYVACATLACYFVSLTHFDLESRDADAVEAVPFVVPFPFAI